MIKRSGAILLLVLYTVTVSGFALNLHYCGKLLASVKISAPVESCSKSARKMKCCNDKQIQVKVKDAHQNVSGIFLAKTFVVDLPKTHFGNLVSINQSPVSKVKYAISPHAPPDNVGVFIRNCTFRI